MKAGRASLLLALLSAAACERPSDAPAPLSNRYVRIKGKDGEVLAVARIDGAIVEERVGSFTAPGDQTLLITNRVGGRDQCSLIVFSESGERLASYRPRRRPPWRDREAFLQPYPPIVGAAHVRGRRYLLAGTIQDFAPTSFAVLEAVDPGELRERLVFWNLGHFHRLAWDDEFIVLAGGNNTMDTATLAVFRWADLPGDGAPATGRSPGRDGGAGFCRYLALPKEGQGGLFGVAELSVADGRVTARTPGGLRWTLTLPDGPFRVEANDAFPRVYRGEAPLAVFLDELPGKVRVWGGDG